MNNRFSRIFFPLAFLSGIVLPANASASGADDWSMASSLTESSYDTTSKLAMNIGRCKDMFDIGSGEVSFIFTLAAEATLSEDAVFSIKLAHGNESCKKDDLYENPDDNCLTITENQRLTKSSSPIEVRRAVSTLSSATDAAGCEDLKETTYLHLIVNDPSSSGTDNIYTVTYSIDFRTTRPSAPSNVTASAGGESIKVKWDSVPDISSYKVYYTSEGSLTAGGKPEEVSSSTATSSSNSITIKSSVSADTTYQVAVTAIDNSGNESLLSEISTVETVSSKDFWDSYREQNQDSDGGFCFIATAAYGSTQEPHVKILRQFRDQVLMQSSAGRSFVATYYRLSPPLAHYIGEHPTARAITRTALWPLYGFAYLLLKLPVVFYSLLTLLGAGIAFGIYRRRRNKASKKSLKAAAPLLAAALAGTSLFAAPQVAQAESPVNMMAEFKAGPYTPDELGDAFKSHFGDEGGFIIEGEYDWQFWRGVGSLGLGFHLAYGNISGKALEEGGGKSIDNTELHWLPLRLSLVYRFDYLWTRFNFPFTIYAKAGFDYYFWWIYDGSDSIARADDGSKGYGGTFGFHVVAGLAFVLDWLAPEMEKSFDVEWGINNSYIFAEYMYAQIDNFGAKGAFNLTDKATFHIGLGLEF
ncbi:MAG: fibronectin type III domain-containing protein [Proteobacteria bacterium]|nr:fibronectin type III domain-containing protein [Pseudomonadota bacterium]